MKPKLVGKWNVNRGSTTYILGKHGTRAVLYFDLDDLRDVRSLVDAAIEAAAR